MLIYKAFLWVQHIQKLIFSNQIQVKFQTFLMPHSGCHVLRFWCILVPTIVDFGIPWRPVVPKMASKIAQMVPKRVCCAPGVATFGRICLQVRFRNSPGHHFSRFWDPLGTKIIDFRTIVRYMMMRFCVFEVASIMPQCVIAMGFA